MKINLTADIDEQYISAIEKIHHENISKNYKKYFSNLDINIKLTKNNNGLYNGKVLIKTIEYFSFEKENYENPDLLIQDLFKYLKGEIIQIINKEKVNQKKEEKTLFSKIKSLFI